MRIQAASNAVENGGGSAVKRKLASLETAKKAASSSGADDTTVAFISILGPRKKAKAGYEERVASIARGREGREKFGSMKGKRKKETPSSSTNREKARNMPIMIMGSKGVRGKKKQSLQGLKVGRSNREDNLHIQPNASTQCVCQRHQPGEYKLVLVQRVKYPFKHLRVARTSYGRRCCRRGAMPRARIPMVYNRRARAPTG